MGRQKRLTWNYYTSTLWLPIHYDPLNSSTLFGLSFFQKTFWSLSHTIWKYLNHLYWRHTPWVFTQYVQNGTNDEWRSKSISYIIGVYNIIGIFVISLMFDGRLRVEEYSMELKGILMWHFWALRHVGIVSSSA